MQRSSGTPARFGWVYILTNPAYPGLVKVGHTGRSPEIRAAELSDGTGVPARFVVAYAHLVNNHQALEGITHGRLAACRINGKREFFRCSVDHARAVIEEEARAQLMPWWRALPHRLLHPLPRPVRRGWESRRKPRDRAGPVVVLAGIAFGLVLALRPAWLPPGLVHLLAKLPHP